jgi:Mg2+ and Co2+ transporter CorA
MSDVQDFGNRPRSSTVASRASNRIPRTPTSPTSHDNLAQDRRGSVASHLSAHSVPDGGMRFRHPSRSNTVKTYHQQPDQPIWQPGAEPGIDPSAEDDAVPAGVSSLKTACDISIIDFSDVDVWHVQANNANLAQLLEQPQRDDLPCRWISVNGLSWDVIKCLGNRFNLHRLAIEDLVHTHTRTKVDWYTDHAFVVLTLQKLVRLHHHRGQNEACNCAAASPTSSSNSSTHNGKTGSGRWSSTNTKRKINDLPYYIDSGENGKVTEFVNAHSGLSENTPIKPIRTLHRYESAQIPEHTAFMEKHSALTAEDLAVSVEQVSIFLLSNNTVISFFEQSAEDVEGPIRERLQSMETMLRRSCDASLLTQAIIDAIVDLAIPVKDAYNRARKELQVDAMTNPNIKTSRSLHIFGEEIDMLQNLFKPIVHLVNALRDHNNEPLAVAPPITLNPPDDDKKPQHRKPGEGKRDREGAHAFDRKYSYDHRTPFKRANTATSVSITPLAHTYFGDVLDHCITMIQTLEQMDASASNISTLIFNTVGARTNNFMMILAVVTVFFAPLTFVSGYFGMNFANGDGLAHPFAYFWVVATPSLVAFMLLVFATMLWDSIKDFFAKRGIKAHRYKRKHALMTGESSEGYKLSPGSTYR